MRIRGDDDDDGRSDIGSPMIYGHLPSAHRREPPDVPFCTAVRIALAVVLPRYPVPESVRTIDDSRAVGGGADRPAAEGRQYQERKEEAISVQSGRLSFEVGDSDDDLESFELLPGESVHIRPRTRHRMVALVDTVVLEASTTELDDVVRLEDR